MVCLQPSMSREFQCQAVCAASGSKPVSSLSADTPTLNWLNTASTQSLWRDACMQDYVWLVEVYAQRPNVASYKEMYLRRKRACASTQRTKNHKATASNRSSGYQIAIEIQHPQLQLPSVALPSADFCLWSTLEEFDNDLSRTGEMSDVLLNANFYHQLPHDAHLFMQSPFLYDSESMCGGHFTNDCPRCCVQESVQYSVSADGIDNFPPLPNVNIAIFLIRKEDNALFCIGTEPLEDFDDCTSMVYYLRQM